MDIRINLLDWLLEKFNTKEEIEDKFDDYYTKSDIRNYFYDKSSMDYELSRRSYTGHTHDDRYYNKNEMGIYLDNKSNIGHTHDDRYYTESEVNDLINSLTAWKTVYNKNSLVIKKNNSLNLLYAKYTKTYNFTDDEWHTMVDDVPVDYRPNVNLTVVGHPSSNARILFNVNGQIQLRRPDVKGSLAVAGEWIYIK